MTSSPFVKAQWIWPERLNWDLVNCYALFRKSFELGTLPKTAPLLITADQSYQLYVNGVYVNRGPARGFQSHWPFDEVDVRLWLKRGTNLLAIRAHNPGFSNFQYLSAGFAGLLVAAKWGKTEIVTDGSWKCRRQVGINRAAVPASMQLFPQEHIDLRTEDPRWMLPEFDDSAWTQRPAATVWNAMPWDQLEERGIPLLEEALWTDPIRGIGQAEGSCAENYAIARNVSELRDREGLEHVPIEFPGEEIRVKPTGPGRFRSYLLDFGRTVVGSFGFEIRGAQGGEIVETLHGESLGDKLRMDFLPDSHCRVALSHRLTCRPGTQTHTFYHAFGFRYVIVTVRDAIGPLKIRPHLRTAFYPLKPLGRFSSSDALLESIWKASAWTQRVCCLDAYVDTPWREQAQWWGDARVQAKNTFFFNGDPRLLRRGIGQIAAQTLPNGLTYGHAPTMAHNCILPDFSLIWLITLWDYYWQTGSLEPFQTHRATLDGILRYFEENTDPETGLVAHDPRYWLFLDWTDVLREGYPTILNLWLLLALDALTRLAKVAGDAAAGRKWSAWARRLRTALRRLELPNGLLADGLTSDQQRVNDASIHSQTLAVLAGLRPQMDSKRLKELILPFLRGESKPKAIPSAYWVTHVFEVASAAGYDAEVLAFIRKKWAPMAAYGGTWGRYEMGRGDASCSHAWSAHPLFHTMQILGGVRQTAAGWSEIEFRPHFEGAFAEVVIPAPPGKIRSAWKRTARGISVQLDLPKGVIARVILPGMPPTTVQGRNRWKVPLPLEK